MKMKAKIFEVMLKKIDQKKKLLEIEINKIQFEPIENTHN